ncbi:hypothetical protein EAE99_007513 [Botrytis elliptica]|nr:hypothetical protein EAE99_007513 [Botrytis elliptica]
MKYTPLSNSIYLPYNILKLSTHYLISILLVKIEITLLKILQTPLRKLIAVYSADLDCDDAYGLLGFVASEQPPFKPTSTDLRTLAQPLALTL